MDSARAVDDLILNLNAIFSGYSITLSYFSDSNVGMQGLYSSTIPTYNIDISVSIDRIHLMLNLYDLKNIFNSLGSPIEMVGWSDSSGIYNYRVRYVELDIGLFAERVDKIAQRKLNKEFYTVLEETLSN